MPKDTKLSAKSALPNPYIFDVQQLALSADQALYAPGSCIPLALVPCRFSICPGLLRLRVECKQFDKEQKRLVNVQKQRDRRQAGKLLEVDAVKSAAPWLVTADGIEVELVAPVQPVKPAAPALAGRVRLVQAELAEAVAPVEAVYKSSRRAKKRRESAGELIVHTIDVTPPHLQPLERAKKMRSRCLETGKLLLSRGEIAKPLFKAGKKVMNCAVWGLYQSVTPEVNYKVGTALCKSRVCPNCQRVLAAKRRGNFLEWWADNKPALGKYFFYHLVLTVRHSAAEGIRTNLYTSDLLGYFAKLRGTHKDLSGATQRERSKAWKSYVAGGTYSCEVKQGRDKSPHIHIHCLIIAKRQLVNEAQKSVFLDYIEPIWQEITGNVDPDAKYKGVFIEKTYYIDRETGNRVDAFKGSQANVEYAVAECEKYTLKADAHDLANYSDEFLTDLLTLRNRYYSRFGCLSANDKTSGQFTQLEKLCTDYQDLEQVTRQELARLLNPETGECVEPEATQFVATPNRNMKPVPVKHEPAPVLLESVKMAPTGQLWPQDGSPLAGTPVYAPVAVAAAVQPPAPDVWKAPELYYQAAELPAWQARAQYHFFPYQEKQRAAIWLSLSIASDYHSDYEYPA